MNNRQKRVAEFPTDKADTIIRVTVDYQKGRGYWATARVIVRETHGGVPYEVENVRIGDGAGTAILIGHAARFSEKELQRIEPRPDVIAAVVASVAASHKLNVKA